MFLLQIEGETAKMSPGESGQRKIPQAAMLLMAPANTAQKLSALFGFVPAVLRMKHAQSLLSLAE